MSLPLSKFIVFERRSGSWLRIPKSKARFQKKIWRNFNIKNATDKIVCAWTEVMQSFVNGIFRNIWPDVVAGFEPKEEVSNSRLAMVDMVRSVVPEEVG